MILILNFILLQRATEILMADFFLIFGWRILMYNRFLFLEKDLRTNLDPYQDKTSRVVYFLILIKALPQDLVGKRALGFAFGFWMPPPAASHNPPLLLMA